MDDPFSQSDHDYATEAGGAILLVGVTVVIVAACLVLMFL